ncbi:hypothetical protein DL95DRAFT_412649 [Leptodontidium sp. 2 PMI_412]|nr:hypothetical protein DL95DRAFT_412649 [Leptodontidium sp. 2 PMI_412]
MGLSSLLGPLLGGTFSDKATWRWCFHINLPIGAITILGVLLLLNIPPPRHEKVSAIAQIKKLDPLGHAKYMGGGATFYPGEDLVIGFKNKTTVTTPWKGIFVGDSEAGPLETGGDFCNSFVLGFWPGSYDPEPDSEDEEDGDETSSLIQSETSATGTSTAIPSPTSWNNAAYPSADIAQENLGTYGGGYLSGFQEYGDTVDEHPATVEGFISTAYTKGMKKIVIDLQRNFGGDALLAIDTFKQFFPKIDPCGGSRLRAQPAANIMRKAMLDYFQTLSSDDDAYAYLYANEWVASTRLNADTNEQFTTWEAFYCPHTSNGDSFTTTIYALFDSLALEAYTDGFVVTRYDNSVSEKSQLFAAENTVILTDRVCSSTFSMFVEMMHNEDGVKTVVVGGRPSYGPMQAVGLSRGVRSYGIDTRLDCDMEQPQTQNPAKKKPQDLSKPSSARSTPQHLSTSARTHFAISATRIAARTLLARRSCDREGGEFKVSKDDHEGGCTAGRAIKTDEEETRRR